jgi:magnesium transporter
VLWCGVTDARSDIIRNGRLTGGGRVDVNEAARGNVHMITTIEFDFDARRERSIETAEIRSGPGPGSLLLDRHGLLQLHGEGQCLRPCAASACRCWASTTSRVAEVLGPDREGRYDVYEDCLHFAVSEAKLVQGRLVTAHVDVVLGQQYLVMFRRRETDFVKSMRRTYREDFAKFAKSPGFLLYEIGDHLTEMYRRTLRDFQAVVEQVQLRLFTDVDDEIFRQVADLTQDILLFRKVVLASRELLHELASRRSLFVSETTQPFLENMAGSLERLGGDLTTEREVLNETLNLYMGMVSHRTNKVVNRLTVISAIFLPLSFLCGVYGVNLKGVPEFEWDFGYAFFWSLCVTIACALLFYMHRRKWL